MRRFLWRTEIYTCERSSVNTFIYMAQHKLLKMRGLSYLVHPHFTKSHTNLFKTCHMPHAWPYGASVPWYHHDDYVTQNWPIRTELTSEHRAWLFVTNWSVIWRPGNSGFDRRQTPFPAAQSQFGKNAAKILAILPLIAEIITKLPKWGSFVACMCHSLLLWNLWPRKPL